MPKLADIVNTVAAPQPAKVDLGAGVVVEVVVDPSRMTGAALQDVYDTQQPREIAACLADLLVEWDITDDDDAPLALTADNLLRLPLAGLMRLLNGIQEQVRPDPKAEGSFSNS